MHLDLVEQVLFKLTLTLSFLLLIPLDHFLARLKGHQKLQHLHLAPQVYLVTLLPLIQAMQLLQLRLLCCSPSDYFPLLPF